MLTEKIARSLRWLVRSGVRERLAQRIDTIGKGLGYYPRSSPRRNIGHRTCFTSGPFRVHTGHEFIELDFKVDLSWDQTRDYRGSKLYYKVEPHHPFQESECILFWARRNGESERLRIVLPQGARQSGWIKLRLDILPLASGAAEVSGCRLVTSNEACEELDWAASLQAKKASTDREVAKSLVQAPSVVAHYPRAFDIELQPKCNLTCVQCPTHGRPEQHEECNKLEEMDVDLLKKLATEVFPHVDCVNLVGRGEQLLASDRLWSAFCGHLAHYGVRLGMVTNGTLVKRRITPELLPLIDTMVVSIDGGTPETFAKNRGGASFERVMGAVSYFHDLRKRACLPRRPKLGVSWTIKKNNVAELPGFVRHIEQFEPDKFFFRHMVLCEEVEQDQTLVDDPATVNAHLTDAYAFLAEIGAEVVRPPLFELPPSIDHVRQSEKSEGDAACASIGTPARRLCPHMYADGSMLSNGTIMSCQAYFANGVGNLKTALDFMSIWSGERMRSLRAGIGTAAEWSQCGQCWISQMQLEGPGLTRGSTRRSDNEPLTAKTRRAWDLRKCAHR